MQIELIEREKTLTCIARVCDKNVVIFCSATHKNREAAIAEAQEWAVVNFGEELEIGGVEVMEWPETHVQSEGRQAQRDARRVRDRSKGINRRLKGD